MQESTSKEFRLPDVGEGLTEAEVVSWKVKPGDTVAVNDVIVEIETAKSLVELPCPFAGVVAALLVPEGVTVPVGTPIIAVSVPRAADQPVPDSVPGSAPESDGEVVAGQRTPVLVGYGPRTGSPARRRRRREPVPADVLPSSSPPQEARALPLAKPPVRKLARDLGVDLLQVHPTGTGGVITRQDVESAAGTLPEAAATGPQPGGERETRIPVRGVRKLTAEAVVASAFTAPHVTEWVQVDVTRTVKLIRRLRGREEFDGVKLSPLVMVAAALLSAVRRHPEINVTFDADAGEIITKHYVNLGIAAATPRGLVVPVIADADRLGLRGLAIALGELTATARAGRTSPAEMSGGTITITNVGVFGVDGGTPIITPGQAAILAVGQIARRPWVHRGRVRPRWVVQLALSFDHRVVDGDLGSLVLAHTAAVLHDPAVALAR